MECLGCMVGVCFLTFVCEFRLFSFCEFRLFHFVSSDYFKISLKMSLIHGLFRNLLFNFQIFMSFPDTLIMISSLISLCYTIAILINLLVFVLWHGIRSILWIFPVHLRRMFSSCRMNDQCQLGQVVLLVSSLSLLIFLPLFVLISKPQIVEIYCVF